MRKGAAIREKTGTERNYGDLIDEVRRSDRPVVVRRKGRAAVVAIDAKSYREMLAQLEQLRTFQGIQRGLDDIAAGRYLTLSQFRRHMEGRLAVSGKDRRKRRG